MAEQEGCYPTVRKPDRSPTDAALEREVLGLTYGTKILFMKRDAMRRAICELTRLPRVTAQILKWDCFEGDDDE